MVQTNLLKQHTRKTKTKTFTIYNLCEIQKLNLKKNYEQESYTKPDPKQHQDEQWQQDE